MGAAYVGLNGSIVKGSEAVISVYDHGFLYGMGLFETFRTYGGGKPYLLDRHLERLADGCRELGIRYRSDAEEVARWVRRLLDANGLRDGYVRLTVSAGAGELGLPAGDYEEPAALLMVKALPEQDEASWGRGRELRLLRTRRNTPEGPVRYKSLHYMNNIIAKRELGEAMSAPHGRVGSTVSTGRSGVSETPESASASALAASPIGAEGLMLSEGGWLAEGIVSNLFWMSGGVVRTPSVDTGILPGVTRRRVLELAAAEGWATEEGLYEWTDLLEADEVWLTNSIQELVPVALLTDVEGRRTTVGHGTAGPAVRRLLAAYREDTKK